MESHSNVKDLLDQEPAEYTMTRHDLFRGRSPSHTKVGSVIGSLTLQPQRGEPNMKSSLFLPPIMQHKIQQADICHYRQSMHIRLESYESVSKDFRDLSHKNNQIIETSRILRNEFGFKKCIMYTDRL